MRVNPNAYRERFLRVATEFLHIPRIGHLGRRFDARVDHQGFRTVRRRIPSVPPICITTGPSRIFLGAGIPLCAPDGGGSLWDLLLEGRASHKGSEDEERKWGDPEPRREDTGECDV